MCGKKLSCSNMNLHFGCIQWNGTISIKIPLFGYSQILYITLPAISSSKSTHVHILFYLIISGWFQRHARFILMKIATSSTYISNVAFRPYLIPYHSAARETTSTNINLLPANSNNDRNKHVYEVTFRAQCMLTLLVQIYCAKCV